jgi:hypothetical protein
VGVAAHQSEGRDRFRLGLSASDAYVMLDIAHRHWNSWGYLPFFMLCCLSGFGRGGRVSPPATDAFHARIT